MLLFEFLPVPWHEMGMTPEAIPKNAAFPMTRWSLVLAVGKGSEDQQQQALAELCGSYWYPLYAYARRRGASVEEAEDLTQSFFANLLEQKVIEHLGGKEHGRLRSYLLTAIQNWMTKQHRKDMALKRGCGTVFSWDAMAAEERYRQEPIHLDSPERLYERRWALMVLDQGIEKLRSDYESAGKGTLAAALIPILSRGDATIPMIQVAALLGVSEGHARVLLYRIRKHFRAALCEIIAQTVDGEAEVAEELRHLQEILLR
jgi:RNA polymerase sigma factor (sigma-70 family)